MAGATLLVMSSSLVTACGWSALEGLRLLGVSRVVIAHPYNGNGAAVTIALRRTTIWRKWVNLLHLLRFGFGRLMFARAKPEQGKMWIAGPLGDTFGPDAEVSDRFALFEGVRQLPPIPVHRADIRFAGEGRYSVLGGWVFFSSTKNGQQRPKSVWMVERNSRTELRLQFSSKSLRRLPLSSGARFGEN